MFFIDLCKTNETCEFAKIRTADFDKVAEQMGSFTGMTRSVNRQLIDRIGTIRI